MIRRFDTLFARLFGGALLAILLAHLLAFIWFTQYGMRPMPPPRPDFNPEHGQFDDRPMHRPPVLGGPAIVLFFQFITMIIAAWYGAKALSRPIQRLSEAAERLSDDLDSPPLEISGPREARQAAQTFNLMQSKVREQMQQRGRMLAAVSHDLRTPLSRLKLRVEQIEEPKLHGQMTQDLNDMISMLDATLAYLNEHRRTEGLQQFDLQALIESQAENAQADRKSVV